MPCFISDDFWQIKPLLQCYILSKYDHVAFYSYLIVVLLSLSAAGFLGQQASVSEQFVTTNYKLKNYQSGNFHILHLFQFYFKMQTSLYQCGVLDFLPVGSELIISNKFCHNKPVERHCWQFRKFRSCRWGPRSRVCARETLRSAPINVIGNFLSEVLEP